MNESEKEKAVEDGLAIQELERGQGWQILKAKIEEETRATLLELRRIELDDRQLSEIGSEYVSRIQRINGLERVLEMVNEIKERYEQATQ